MSFRLVDTGWDKELADALVVDCSAVRIVCPFIKRRTAERLLKHGKPAALQIITRFNLDDFGAGVSDLSALRLLLESGAQIRGVRHLHAKLYLLGASRAIVTSANLTEAGLLRNHELGFVGDEPRVVGACQQYFDNLWSRAGQDLQASRLAAWESKIDGYLASGARPLVAGFSLGDEGVEAGVPAAPLVVPAWVGEAPQGFVKFFGMSKNRMDRAQPVFDEVGRSGSHWACTYPEDRRPRSVQEGAIMFMGRLVKEPNDIVIYGRATAREHRPGRDDAKPQDLALRPWKKDWPHYVRVHHAEFINGAIANGISLNAMMEKLKEDSFASTQRRAAKGETNIDPRSAYLRKPGVELSPEGIAWMSERLENAFLLHGKIPPAELDRLDWPTLP